jgi:serine/threonine-protein kinase
MSSHDSDTTRTPRTSRHWSIVGEDGVPTAGPGDGDAASWAGRDPGPGDHIGEYVLHRRIGRGGMGVVYSAEHPLIGKRVAVKLLAPGVGDDEMHVQRFVDEARAVNRIHHPNIVDIFGFGELPSGHHYYVMELLDGRTLKQRLKQPPRPSLVEGLRVIVDVCEALVAAHDAGIIHRDLKPENIFLHRVGGGELTKLLDFGLAKLVDVEPGRHQTAHGKAIGTPWYMSPEQCAGEAVTASADVYAIGCILYELATGQVPFPRDLPMAAIAAHLGVAPRPPRELCAIPPALDALILECLAKKPVGRPRDVATVRDRLRTIMSAPPEPDRVGLTSLDDRVPRRRGWLLVPAVIVVVLALVLTAVLTRRTRPVVSPAPSVPAPARPSPPAAAAPAATPVPPPRPPTAKPALKKTPSRPPARRSSPTPVEDDDAIGGWR